MVITFSQFIDPVFHALVRNPGQVQAIKLMELRDANTSEFVVVVAAGERSRWSCDWSFVSAD